MRIMAKKNIKVTAKPKAEQQEQTKTHPQTTKKGISKKRKEEATSSSTDCIDYTGTFPCLVSL